MLNPFNEVDWNPDREKRRSFAVSLLIGFPLIGLALALIGYLRGFGWDFTWPLRIGLGGATAGLLFWLVPAIARPFYVVWFFIACCIGLVVGNVMMALVYYVFVAGLGLAMRVAGRRALQKGVDRSALSYWRAAGPRQAPRRYYRQF